MRQDLIQYVNSYILSQAKSIRYTVKDLAPSTEVDLFNSSSLIIWSGESTNTIYQDETVNHAFRAIHDAMHLKTRLSFSPEHEMHLGKIQASKISSSIIADLFYIEIAGQAEYYLKNNKFVDNQVEFTMSELLRLNK